MGWGRGRPWPPSRAVPACGAGRPYAPTSRPRAAGALCEVVQRGDHRVGAPHDVTSALGTVLVLRRADAGLAELAQRPVDGGLETPVRCCTRREVTAGWARRIGRIATPPSPRAPTGWHASARGLLESCGEDPAVADGGEGRLAEAGHDRVRVAGTIGGQGREVGAGVGQQPCDTGTVVRVVARPCLSIGGRGHGRSCRCRRRTG